MAEIPERHLTRYKLAKAQLALVPAVSPDDSWERVIFSCNEVISFCEELGTAEARVRELEQERERILKFSDYDRPYVSRQEAALMETIDHLTARADIEWQAMKEKNKALARLLNISKLYIGGKSNACRELRAEIDAALTEEAQ
jgi:hypothetical protein